MRLRLMLSFILIVLVSVTSVVLIARYGVVKEVRTFMLYGGMTDAPELVSALEDHYRQYGAWNGVENILTSGHGRGMGMGGQGRGMMSQRLQLADTSYTVVADTAATSVGERLAEAEISSAIPIQIDGKTVGYLLTEGGMGFYGGAGRSLLDRMNRAAFIAGLVAGGFSLLLALLLAYSLLRPVQELTQAARRLGQGDLSQRVRVAGNDEVAVLGSTFNRMADSLQQAEETRRAMTADIAHELRNPLAVQRASLEAFQDGIYPLTAENLKPVLEQNLLLTHLVDDLRTLALAESGQLKLECTPTDLSALAERVVERFKPQAAGQRVELHVDADLQALPLLAIDPMRVEQILNNLLANALRYTPEGGRIDVTVQRGADQVRLQVRDSGPGIPVDALPHIFERFYRVDRSRSRSEGGSGLGLAIARRLAEAHGATLAASNHPDGGALFSLEFPVEPKG
jgi:signal transduction histidine kinase